MALPDDELPDDPEMALRQMEDPDSVRAPDPHGLLKAEHEETIDDLSSEPENDNAEIADEHSQVIDELSSDAPDPQAEQQNTPPPVDNLAEISLGQAPSLQPPGRHSVPPSKRTPANRAQRRAEHDRVLGQNEPPADLRDFLAGGGKAPEDDNGGQEPMKEFLDALTGPGGLHEGIATLLTEATRRTEELNKRLERERI